jgi:hypothetical protein
MCAEALISPPGLFQRRARREASSPRRSDGP